MSATTRQNLSATAQSEMAVRLHRNDPDVLNDILRAFGKPVLHNLRTAFPFLNEHDLEDILAESLFRTWNARARYAREKGSLFNWFIHISRNAAIDTLKPGWRQAQVLECPLTGDMPIVDTHADRDAPEEKPTPSAARQDLRKILDSLPETDRSIIHAYACSRGAGSWTRPLVDELNMSTGAIRTKAHRLLKKIRTEMQRLGYDVACLSKAVPTANPSLRP